MLATFFAVADTLSHIYDDCHNSMMSYIYVNCHDFMIRTYEKGFYESAFHKCEKVRLMKNDFMKVVIRNDFMKANERYFS